MIVDKIENIDRYPQLREIASQITTFVKNMEEQNLENGKYALQGDCLYAIVQRYTTKEKTEARLESHRKYADLQYIHRGEETIFYDSVDDLEIEEDYNPEKDIAFYKAKADKGGIRLKEGMFGYYEPQDAHMPCISSAEKCQVIKIVFKILL